VVGAETIRRGEGYVVGTLLLELVIAGVGGDRDVGVVIREWGVEAGMEEVTWG
jgi:hypothetical protein